MAVNLLKQKKEGKAQSSSGAPKRNLLQEKREFRLQPSSPMRKQPAAPQQGTLGYIAEHVGNLGSGIIGGALQSTYDKAKSAANLGADLLNTVGNSPLLRYSLNDSDFDEWEAARNPEMNPAGRDPIGPLEVMGGYGNRELPRVPEMQIQEKNPSSSLKRFGQFVGGAVPDIAGAAYLGPMAAPAAEGLAVKAGLQSNPIGLMIARSLGASAGGAAEGYVTGDENNRGMSAAFGAGTAGLSQLGSDLWKSRSAAIAKDVQNKVYSLKDSYGEQFRSVLREGEEAGANAHLKPIAKDIYSSIEGSKYSKLSNSLRDFNEKPTLSGAHKAQSDLNKIIMDPKAANSKVYENAVKAQNRLMAQISKSFEEAGASESKSAYEALRKGYAQEVAPYLDSKSVTALIRDELRPEKFTGEILKDQKFLAQVGKNHPDLLLNESLSNLAQNRLVQGATTAAGFGLASAAGIGVPNHIQKLFNH